MPLLIDRFEKDLKQVDLSLYPTTTETYIVTDLLDAYHIKVGKSFFPPYNGMVTIFHLKYDKIEWISEEIDDFKDQNPDAKPTEIYEHLNALTQFNEPELIGCVAFNHYHDSMLSGIQIKASFVEKEHQRNLIATQTYQFLATQYQAVISDQLQTPLAQKLWALSLTRQGNVSIYDSHNRCYVTQTMPKEKIAIWNIPLHDPKYYELSVAVANNSLCHYLSEHDCQHILLVLTA